MSPKFPVAGSGVVRFPEWKQLFDSILPLIESGKTSYTYDELSTLARLDVRGERGRAQFYRFRRQLLKDKQLWMEVIPKLGYRIIQPGDQPHAARRRMQQAGRKVRLARAINTNIQIENLTPEQRLLQAATAAVLHELSKTFHTVAARLKLAAQDAQKLPVDMPALLDNLK